MSAKITTLVVASLFLALAVSGVADSQDGDWAYIENKNDKGASFDAGMLVLKKQFDTRVLTFSFQPDAQCKPKVGVTFFHFGNSWGKFGSSAQTPDEYAVQVDDNPPEQRRAVSDVYTNSFEILIPVSRALVRDAKAGNVLRFSQMPNSKYPLPPGSLTHVEVSLRGVSGPLDQAEAACAAAP